EVINEAQRSIRDIEEAITQVEGSVTRLVHMRYARFADLKVCEKRLQLRERRPARENFADSVDEALNRERAVLERARQDLLTLEAEAQRYLSDLQAMRIELSRDTGARRLQVESELAHMRSATGPSLPEVNKPAHQVIKLLTEEEAKSLKERSVAVIARSNQLPGRAERLTLRIRQEGEQATKRSGKQLAAKTRELSEFKKHLEENIRGVEHTHSQACQALTKEEGRLETVMGDKALQDTKMRVEELRAMVQELQQTQQALVEELRCKAAALEIDNSCRRVTPQAAAEPPKLTSSASAPNFRKAEGREDKTLQMESPEASSNGTAAGMFDDRLSPKERPDHGQRNHLPPISPKSASPSS
ncbi:unnamed protein product, partial [Effrenium voratum]